LYTSQCAANGFPFFLPDFVPAPGDSVSFFNVYDDPARAAAYATLEFPATYYLAYRDLPDLFRRRVPGKIALDFGCGTGRSSRFLKRSGFHAIGVDIANSMIERAKRADPEGDYRLVEDGDLSAFEPSSFDLILSAFTFDNVPDVTRRRRLLAALRRLVKEDGTIVFVCSTPDIYVHE
jgi:ubiquinone/menaquinone biosynthesis C-methylase UbiE